MKRIVLIKFIMLFCFIEVHSQQRPDAVKRSYLKARQVLDASVSANGGIETLFSVQNVTFSYSGRTFARFQSPTTEPPFMPLGLENKFIIDSQHGRFFNEQKVIWPGFVNWTGTIIKPDGAYTLNHNTKTVSVTASPFINDRGRASRLLPNLILRDAVERAKTLRWVREEIFEGVKHSVISFVTSDGTLLTLYINSRTNLISKYKTIDHDFLAGDTVSEGIFLAYRNAGRLKVPTSFVEKIDNEVDTEFTFVEIKFNDALEQSLFEIPKGFTTPTQPTAKLSPQVVKVANDVYLLRNLEGQNYNVLFVAFNDYILVVEAPISSTASQSAIVKIKETIPNKPIRYIVPTHHHDDHTGGLRTYIAEGSTIITTPGNKRFFERLGTSSRTIEPDYLTRNQRPPLIKVIENKKFVLQDGKRRVEIYDAGPTPHAKEIIFVYLPEEKILFQGDLMGFMPDGEVEPARDATLIFADKVRDLKLDVNTLFGVHGRPGTLADLLRAVEKRRLQGN